MLGVAIEPERRGDEQRLSDTLHKVVAEDPCVRVEHHATVNETVLYGMGELHLRVLLERMTERYGVHIKTHPPSIPYRETVVQPADGHCRHKKQTGGAGQFGEVYLRVEALPRGTGFEFEDEVVGGAIPGSVHSGRGERRAPGARRRCDRRLSAAGHPRHRLRRQAPRGRFQGSRVRIGGTQGVPRCDRQGQSHRARADREGGDRRAFHVDGRHHRRPCHQARPHQRQRPRSRADACRSARWCRSRS